eukprot:gene9706-1911_t
MKQNLEFAKSLTSKKYSTQKTNYWLVDSVHNPEWNKESIKTKNFDILHKYRFDYGTHKGNIHDKIVLTQFEERLFKFLLQVNKQLGKNTVLRVAGGWVRDKLLGKDSKDIDIALDNLMGIDFATAVHKYQEDNNYATSSIGLIKKDNEKSKHLETATTHIFGQEIDFVNLRSEKYSDSRVPEVEFGSPKEDALRRDLTINSLFYNINEGKVEDFTGFGISDLKLGIIRTPLEPLQTFVDDPLRVLRTIRFACRYNFLVSDEVIEGSKDERVEKAFSQKLSRERVGIEMEKIITSNDPIGGFSLINEMGMRQHVFTVPKITTKQMKLKPYLEPESIVWTNKEWNNSLFRCRIMFKLAKKYSISKEHSSSLMFSLLSPVIPETLNFEETKFFIDKLILCSFKLPVKLSSEVTNLIYHSKGIKKFVLIDKIKFETTKEEIFKIYHDLIKDNLIEIGLWLRQINSLWEYSIWLSSVLNTKGTEFDEYIYQKDFETLRCEVFVEVIKSLSLNKLIEMKPLLNGKEIAQILNINPGKQVGLLLQKLVEKQISEFFNGFNKEDAVKWIKEFSSLFKE